MALSVVQSKSGTGTSGTSVTVTLTSATTAHNCLVVAVGEANTTTNPTVTGVTLGGSAGNFTLAASLKNNSDANAELWVDRDCTGSQTSVVVSFTGGTGTSNNYVVWVHEVAGADTTSPVDKTAAAGASSGTSWSSGATATLSQAAEIAIGIVCAEGSAGNPSMSGPASLWTNNGPTTASRTSAISSFQVVSATTALTYAGTTTSAKWGVALVTLKAASVAVTGTGTMGLGSLSFSGSGSVVGGNLALGGLRFAGTGVQKFTGTGSLTLGGLGFSGSQTTVTPTIPTEPAGVIATSRDLNDWANAASFFLGSTRGTQPMFFLMASATQGLTTSFTAVTYSSSAPVFKDNNGAWSSGTPSRVTVMTPGFYTVAWSVSAASGAGHLQAYAQVTTTAANPFNPSTTLKFQESNRAATTSIVVTSSGGLVPFYLATGDYIEVYALVGTAENTSLTLAPQLSGEWVSS